MAGVPISEVARQARVSSRTLRHHDEIGLLHPASIGANGHRYYEPEQLLLGRLAETVARTIDELEGGPEVTDLFEGFEEKQAQAEEELVARYGEGVRQNFAEAREKTQGWSRGQYQDAAAQYDALDARMLAVLRDGEAPDSEAAFAVLEDHHAAVSAYWTPSADAYVGLGGWYVENAEFRARYDAKDPRLAEFYRDAMAAYAAARLS